MAHTTSYDDNIHFLHNGDYSGDVEVVVPSATAEMKLSHHDHTVSIKIPYAALEYLVTMKVVDGFANTLADVTNMNELFKALMMPQYRLGPIVKFVQYIASLDNPKNLEERRRISLQDLIREADDLL
jgi:hypothetical protein